MISAILSRKYHYSTGICLCYHEVRDKEYQFLPRTSLVMTEKDFERHVQFISNYLNIMHPNEFLVKMREGTLPPRSCIITFDDGFASTLNKAYPILRKYNMPFIVFISTGFVSNLKPWDDHILQSIIYSAQFQGKKIIMFDDLKIEFDYSNSSKIKETKMRLFQIFQDKISFQKRERFLAFVRETLNARNSPDYPRMLTEDEVQYLSANGVVIGAHTEWHVSVEADGPEIFYQQVNQSKKTLEGITGKRIYHFAYPYGLKRHCVNAVELIRECGFQYAFTASSKPSHSNQMPYLISRIGASWGLVSLVMGLFECKPSQLKNRFLRKK